MVEADNKRKRVHSARNDNHRSNCSNRYCWIYVHEKETKTAETTDATIERLKTEV